MQVEENTRGAPEIKSGDEQGWHIEVNPVATRIRRLREDAGMSQGDLASKVFVSRQTVINWEKGRTLPDAGSLKRLSAEFGITLDALLDERSEAFIRRTDRERRAIKIAIALNAAWLFEKTIGFIVTMLSYMLLDSGRAYVVSQFDSIVGGVILLMALFASFRVNRIKDKHGLASVVDVAAFLEGYQPGAALPQTFIWRWLLPHWTQVYTVFIAILIVSVLLPLFVLRFAGVGVQ